LAPDSILTLPEEGLNVQVLFNPLEKQLDLPPCFVKLGNGYTGQFKVIGQEYQGFTSFRVFKFYAA
jgi:hypothetical protein